MEISGTIIAILQQKSGVSARTGNGWMSQDYVIQTVEQYPKKCVFTVFGEDRIKQFNIQMNEQLTVQFDIDAHEYQGRWFNETRAYNVIRAQQQGYHQQQMQQGYQQMPQQQMQQQNPFPPQQVQQQQQAQQQGQTQLPFPPQQ